MERFTSRERTEAALLLNLEQAEAELELVLDKLEQAEAIGWMGDGLWEVAFRLEARVQKLSSQL